MKAKTDKMLAVLYLSILACTALFSGVSARACTDFCYSQGDTVLTGRSWDLFDAGSLGMVVVPATAGKHGWVSFGHFEYPCADGMNDQGLYIGDASVPTPYVTTSSSKPADFATFITGLLANCATVDEAIAWSRKQPTPSLDGWVHRNSQGDYTYVTPNHFLVADRSGDSVVLEWPHGKLKTVRKRGRYLLMTNFLLTDPQAGWYPCSRFSADSKILDNASGPSLETCRQVLETTAVECTKYSVIYDLTHGDVHVYLRRRFDLPKTFHLADELQKGGHKINLDQWFLVHIDPKIYDRYVGQYQFPQHGPAGRQVALGKSSASGDGPTLNISHVGDCLVASVRGLQEFPSGNIADFVPVSSNSFVVDPDLTGDNIQLTFPGDMKGKATSIVVNWNWNVFNGTRTAAATDFANAGAGPDIQGAWEGTLEQPGYGVDSADSRKSRIVLKITRVNGAYQSNLIDMGDSGTQRQFDTFAYRYPYVHGGPVESDGSFVGMVDLSGGKISGDVLKYGQYWTMMVRRTTHPTQFHKALTEAEFAPRAGSDLQGFWVGTIGRGKTRVGALDLPISIQVKILEASDATYRADFYCPDPHANRQPGSVSYDGTTVKLTLWDGYGMFEGRLGNGGKEMTGNWIQGGHHIQTTLTQANYSEYTAQAAK